MMGSRGGGPSSGRLLAGFLRRNCPQSPIKSGLLSENRQFRLVIIGSSTSFSSSSSSATTTTSSSSSCFMHILTRSYPMPLLFRSQRLLCISSSSQFRATATDTSSSSSSSSSSSIQEIAVRKLDGLPVFCVPMPSRHEKCRFVLKPLANTLSDFVSFLKLEDSAIGHVEAYTEGGELIPGLTSIDVLLKNNFYLKINDNRFLVRIPEQGEADGLVSNEKAEELRDVKDTVARLFRALHSDRYHAMQQSQLSARLEVVKAELEPLEKIRNELHMKATRRTQALSWVGLGLMGLQFGFLARLTWWEYSWDIMEPVTYFVTYGTAMAMFAYHLLTIQDYAYPDAYDREVVMTIHRLARKNSFNVPRYNQLRSEKARLEFDLERLRNPLENKISPSYLPQIASSTNSLCKA